MTSRLEDLRDRFRASPRMPVVFLGHGSPMNALEDTPSGRAWAALGQSLPRPQAILVVSAHWMTQGSTLVDISAHPRVIHDFYGFPEPLYQMDYPAPGAPDLARETAAILASHHAETDDRWGLDHGAWVVLRAMYPEANLPVYQVSVDMSRGLAHQLEIGRSLAQLRDRGVLILGSGNIVHNLRAMQPGGAPLDFAQEFDSRFAAHLEGREMAALADEAAWGSLLHAAHPSVDHYLPALTVAGAAAPEDDLSFMTQSIDLGSVSMRSFIFQGG